ncbi:MAG: NAD(+) synthase [Desulfobacterota bacterium]|jgi:NAD+ synthase|nr:NAD(+) synthase [Thermodesulfobacteriota bacterium]
MAFGPDILKIDPEHETRRIAAFLQEQVKTVYRRSGIVVGLSGGIDSAVMSELAVRALGREAVVGLVLPEGESNPVSSSYARAHAEKMGISCREVDITATVDSVMPYALRDEYIRSLVPEYGPGCRYNISLPTDLLERESFSFYVIQVQLADGTMKKKRLGFEAFRAITSFANIKIRARMLHLYSEAERRGYVVAGTTNRTEFLLGDFCKYGDGGTDIEALSHLYKNQIYQLADCLGVIPEIIDRSPSPDTFSLPVTDQEFFFRIPFEKLDHLLYAWEHGIGIPETASALGLSEDAVKRAFTDFTAKSRATAHLRVMPYCMEPA